MNSSIMVSNLASVSLNSAHVNAESVLFVMLLSDFGIQQTKVMKFAEYSSDSTMLGKTKSEATLHGKMSM